MKILRGQKAKISKRTHQAADRLRKHKWNRSGPGKKISQETPVLNGKELGMKSFVHERTQQVIENTKIGRSQRLFSEEPNESLKPLRSVGSGGLFSEEVNLTSDKYQEKRVDLRHDKVLIRFL
jgi:hypothetical protein